MNYDVGEPILLIPREGSAIRPTGLSSHPPNHLAFYYYLADNRYRCLTNNTTENEQQQGPPVHRGLPYRPIKARGYQQGEPSPYLFSHVLLVELDFSWFGNSREIRAGAKHASNVGGTLPVVLDAIPLAGIIGSPDSYL